MILFSISILALPASFSQGYNVGDIASDFKLKNTDGNYVSLSNYRDARGFIIIFTCNHCPYAKAYQDRIMDIDDRYRPLGYPVIAINPNDPDLVPEDSYENMVMLAQEKDFSFPYLFDEKQEVYRKYGAKRTPHVFLLEKNDKQLIVRYIGAIDDNYEDPSLVKTPYLADAVDALISGMTPKVPFTKAIGCSIKDKTTQ
jgi:peroxiredoxin